ncbi:hypothetical protein B0T14DRAFT_570204 [Immersiella caudata]|uniref:Clock-controlled protein 6 n=1 Tax=Immersiella caudata TaxID=314043 RepID=A0AA39WF55_9PEZI|nr:hypothetical protein B0T14DRAFT_570204 [Immersiella caudata]
MKFSAVAVLAVAAGVNAFKNVTYTTEVVTAVTTYCPEPTEITYGGTTYTITEATTLTISDCPCTISKPVTVIPEVICHTCGPPAKPTWAPAKNYTQPAPTGAPVTTKPGPVTAGAGKAAALSAAGLAGILGLAAFVL